jgi:hypothetical protein
MTRRRGGSKSRLLDEPLVCNKRGVGNYSYHRGRRAERFDNKQEPISPEEEAWARQLTWFIKTRNNYLKGR